MTGILWNLSSCEVCIQQVDIDMLNLHPNRFVYDHNFLLRLFYGIGLSLDTMVFHNNISSI